MRSMWTARSSARRRCWGGCWWMCKSEWLRRRICHGNSQSLSQCFEHRFRHQFISVVGEMHAVFREDALFFVLLVVFLQVIREGFVQIAQRLFHVFCNFAADIGVFGEHLILLVVAVGFFADDS